MAQYRLKTGSVSTETSGSVSTETGGSVSTEMGGSVCTETGGSVSTETGGSVYTEIVNYPLSIIHSTPSRSSAFFELLTPNFQPFLFAFPSAEMIGYALSVLILLVRLVVQFNEDDPRFFGEMGIDQS